MGCYGDNLNLLPHPITNSTPPAHRPKYGHVCRGRWGALGWKRRRLEEGMWRGEKRLDKAIGKERINETETFGNVRVNKVGCTENRENKGWFYQ